MLTILFLYIYIYSLEGFFTLISNHQFRYESRLRAKKRYLIILNCLKPQTLSHYLISSLFMIFNDDQILKLTKLFLVLSFVILVCYETRNSDNVYKFR